MRIIVASPSKTGNVWMKHLLASAYGLTVLEDVPGIPFEALLQFIAAGKFQNKAIFHQHFRPTDEFFDFVAAENIQIVTTIRHPYDVFVSLFFYVQRLSHLFEPGTHFYPLVGKPLGHPDVLAYLRRGRDGFGLQVELALGWVERQESHLVRYEDLIKDPVGELKGLTDQLSPIPLRKIRKAVEKNRAETLRKHKDALGKHVRKASSGDWRNHLQEAHLDAINTAHGAAVYKMGYPLFDSPNVGSE